MTHTFATMAVSPLVWDEIHGALRDAAYSHAILVDSIGEKTLDMQGIGLVRKTDAEMHDENYTKSSRVEKLEKIINKMIDELSATYQQEFASRHVYPHMMVRYNRDMSLVREAQKLLQKDKGE